MDTYLFSIQQAASLSLTILYRWVWSWRLTLLPFYLDIDRSLDTALFYYAQQAGCILLTSLHHWFIVILSKKFPTIYVDPYDLVILEEKMSHL